MRKKNVKKDVSVKIVGKNEEKDIRISEVKIKLGDIASGYVNNSLKKFGSVVGMDGNLIMQPRFQRTYVVDQNEYWRTKLIESIINNAPIGTIYVGVPSDLSEYSGKYLLVDGQQRLITACDFVDGRPYKFNIGNSVQEWMFNELPEEIQQSVLDYEITLHVCTGTEEKIREWFKIINQPSNCLMAQEIRNCTNAGIFVDTLKEYFSAASVKDIKETNDKDSKYNGYRYGAKGSTKDLGMRQEILELALDWASYYDCVVVNGFDEADVNEIPLDDRISKFMSKNRDSEEAANNVISLYKEIIDWINRTFRSLNDKFVPQYQSMAKADWGRLYSKHKDDQINVYWISKQLYDISKNIREVYSFEGVYEWLLDGANPQLIDRYIQCRTFSKDDRERRYNEQMGYDPIEWHNGIRVQHELTEMVEHHIVPWIFGGSSLDYNNLVMLTKESHEKCHGCVYTSDEIREMRDRMIMELKNLA